MKVTIIIPNSRHSITIKTTSEFKHIKFVKKLIPSKKISDKSPK